MPTAFATLIEPVWVLLNRLLCITQPFKDLWKRLSKAPRSMASRYSAIPPQLAVWHSMSNGHYLLALVCTTSLLANVLAVGLSGLLREKPVIVMQPVEFRPEYSPHITEETFAMNRDKYKDSVDVYNDPFFVLMANMFHYAPLPPWLSEEYLFPLAISKDMLNSGPGTFTVQTQGFGASVSCLPLIPYNETVLLWDRDDADHGSVSCNITLPTST